MSTVEILALVGAEVEVIVEGAPAIGGEAAPIVEVQVETPGVQGPPGAAGQDAAVIDPGDLTLYFQNGLT